MDEMPTLTDILYKSAEIEMTSYLVKHGITLEWVCATYYTNIRDQWVSICNPQMCNSQGDDNPLNV